MNPHGFIMENDHGDVKNKMGTDMGLKVSIINDNFRNVKEETLK